MKIALMAPAGAMHRYDGSFKRLLHYAPLTLTTLAALVPEDVGAEIKIYDETVQFLPRHIDADLIGLTAITGTSQRVYRWADFYRSRGIPIVLGGVHPTLMPHEAKRHADAVVVGYGEKSWPRLLRDFRQGRMQPFYHMHSDFSLAGRPIPSRHLLDGTRYITRNSVEATRGCLHACCFCAVPAAWGRRVYTRPVEEVIAEVEQLPGRDVIFVDVNLIANPTYAKKLFRELVPLNRRWFGLVTSNVIRDDDLFDLMIRSGCRGVLIGFESVTDASLHSIGKRFTPTSKYKTTVERLHDAGVGINGTFIFGTDGDDRTVFERTVERIQRLRIDLPRYAIMTPFPGSGLYQRLESQGRIIERDWSLYDVEHCVIQPNQMSPEALEEGLEWAWKETYRLVSIAQRVVSWDRRLLLGIPLNLGYRFYARKLPHFSRDVMTNNADVPTP